MTVAGLTYAEYARRGFFELVAVAVLAGMLVVALDLVVAVRGRAQLVASLALLGLTAIVLLSAFVRLRLYQDMYGWTELRFIVVVAIGWLAVALVATAWLLLARMTRWTLHVLGIMVLVTVAGMNLVGPQAFVTDRNLERALNPAIVPAGGRTGLDGSYLSLLGDEAVPAAVAAYERLSPESQVSLDWFLAMRRTALEDEAHAAGLARVEPHPRAGAGRARGLGGRRGRDRLRPPGPAWLSLRRGPRPSPGWHRIRSRRSSVGAKRR